MKSCIKFFLVFSFGLLIPLICLCQNNIIQYEYWYDGNWAGRTTTPVSPNSTFTLNQGISTSSLTSGLHIFNLRFKDANSLYSSVISQHFYKLPLLSGPTNNITAYEYWFDNNYAGKIFQGTTPQSTLQLITDISTVPLVSGLHIFNVRFKDEKGQWSSAISQHFYKLPTLSGGTNNITAYEYWFDNNYAGKISQGTTPQSTFQLITDINTVSLVNGLHLFNVRFKDEKGQWSSAISQHFYKGGNLSGISNSINGYRYWIDSDVSSLTTVNLPVTTNPRYILEQINLANLDTGAHVMNLQFRDLQNQWSCAIADTFYQLGQPRIDIIVPAKGGNIGDVTVFIYGTGFYPGTSVKLTRSGYPDIVAPDSLTGIFNGQKIRATFNLLGQAIGNWNLVVTVPNDTIMILVDGFSVESGIAAQPWADIIGFNVVRANQWQNFTYIVGNSGNVDATGVPLWLAVPQNIDVQTTFPIHQSNDTLGIKFDTIPKFYLTDTLLNEVGNYKVIPLFVPKVSPSQTVTLNLKLRSSVNQQFDIQTWAGKPLYQSLLNQEAVNCYADIANQVFTNVLRWPYNCLYSVIDFGWRPVLNRIIYHQDVSFGSLKDNLMPTLISCVPQATSANVVSKTDKIFKIISRGYDYIGDVQTSSDCTLAFLPQLLNPKIKKHITTVASYDPNDKLGPSGSGIKNYYSDNKPYSYIVHFENDSAATAWAQNVTIIDTLDLTVFDISTFQLGYFSFGDTTIYIPQGNKNYSSLIDLRPKNIDVIVKVEATLSNAGILVWEFSSLDPLNLQPVANPLVGFLPPNINEPDGEGSIFYQVNLQDSLVNNTAVSNIAYIFFDNNPAIPTNTWTNTIDNIKPHSKVDPLPQFVTDTSFSVKWSGIDTSSGVKDYSIYVAVNSGTYQRWLLHTTNTSAVFTGLVDSTYSFYSIAIDSAGNVESIPLVADAVTTISFPTKVNNISISGFALKIYPNPSNSSVTIEYCLDQSSDVSVAIYNPLGKAVSVLTKGKQENGFHKIVFNGNNLSSGIYYCEIIVNGERVVNKIVLNK